MKRKGLFTLMVISLWFMNQFVVLAARPILKPASVPHSQQISTEGFNIYGLPVYIESVKLEDTSDGYTFICSVFNQSDDQIREMQAYLLVLNEAGDVEYAGYRKNTFDTAGYETKDWSIDLGTKVDDKSRVLIVITDVTGKAYRWKAPKADNALGAYAKGEGYVLPEVLKAKN